MSATDKTWSMRAAATGEAHREAPPVLISASVVIKPGPPALVTMVSSVIESMRRTPADD